MKAVRQQRLEELENYAVRIYDISKKLGLENKEVLAKAKGIGHWPPRGFASSSLDKITASTWRINLSRHPN